MRAYNFICKKCGYTTTHRGTFDRHVKRKTLCDQIEIELRCKMCGKMLSNMFSLRRHEENKNLHERKSEQ